MMEVLVSILKEQGLGIAILAFFAIVLWRTGPTLREWVSMLVAHLIQSSKARTEAMRELATILTELRLSNERMHAETLRRSEEVAKQQRHDFRDALQQLPSMLASEFNRIHGAIRAEGRAVRLILGHNEPHDTEESEE